MDNIMIKIENMIVPLSHYRKWLIPFQDEKTREFIQKARLIHGDKYEYKFVKYINSKIKVCLICHRHGEFWITPDSLCNAKSGCKLCGLNKQEVDTLDDFIKKSVEVHGNLYDYSKAIYINNRTKIEIICPIQGHGSFWQIPDNHLKGCGCPMCLNKCESYVGEWLKDNNFMFKYHQKVDIIKIKDNIEIDYIISYNGIDYWIEYNGIQHYMYVEHFHRDNIENFKDQLRRDEKVKNYCYKNNIFLLEIPYIYNTKNSIYLFLDKVLINKINPNLLVNYESLYRRPLEYTSILDN